MGKHNSTHGSHARMPVPGQVTLGRVGSALSSLGYDYTEREDRIVVGAHAFTAGIWLHHERPHMLVIDFTDRIPTDFSHGTALARFLNTWNHDHVGPVASYRLMDSGDFRVALRRGIRAKHGLDNDQLVAELADAFEHAAIFTSRLRQRFLDARLDQPLPPQLMRAQDAEALLGRHPSERHLTRDTQPEVAQVPELFDASGSDPETRVTRVRSSRLAETLDALEFRYAIDNAEGIIATGVNGVPFALTLDGAPASPSYVRVTAMWDTGLDADESFLPAWLVCNDVNERTSSLGTYLHEHDGGMHVHAECTLLASAGASERQLGEFVISSLISGLAAVDHVSRQLKGESAVQWPPRG